ncbi:MAG: hypothetical protein Q7S83_03115 [bacterium]|nr:hypothetical protein [bacterium]
MNRRAIFIVGGVILLSLTAIGFLTYRARFSRGLEIEVFAPEEVSIGIPFDLRVGISNSSANILENVRLAFTLPEGLAFVGSPVGKNLDFRDLNNLGSGSLSQQTFKLVALSGENTFKRITVGANYISGSLSSRFEKEVTKDIAVGSYGLTLDIAAPQKVFNGESFDAEISFKNNSDIDLDNLKLKIDYPLTFILAKSTLPPDIGNNTWVLGGLRKGSDMKFKVSGNLIGPEDALFDLRATIESVFSGQSYPISSNVAAIAIAASPISLKITLNGNTDSLVKIGEDLTYKLSYVNNTDVGLRDVIVKAQLSGVMFDLGTLSTNGSFRSSDSTLSWNASNVSELQTLAPAESGSVEFRIRSKSAYPIKRLSDKNFTLKVVGTIESPTVPHFVSEGKAVSFASIENKVQGRVELAASAFFRDAISGILNKGPMPPKVNQPTNFTIHWAITNYSTDLKDVEVRAFLGGNVKCTGIAKSSVSTIPICNDRTQEVIWQVPKVVATSGITGKPVEAIFQVEAVPSSADLNRTMVIIQDTSLKAVDEFTGMELTNKDSAITTQLPDDPTVNGQGVVTQ